MLNNKPLVSICCLTYNHERFVHKAIDSILLQKVDFAYEILIHDDASTDSTQEIIKEYYDLHPNIIKPIFQSVNQYSQNVSITAKFQLPRARGRYIAFCEGDDYWIDPYKLSKQVAFLEKNKEYIATTHQCLIIDENEKPIARYSPTFLYVSNKSRVFTQKDAENFLLPGQTATLVFNKNAIDNYNLSEWTNYLMDFSLTAFLSLQGYIYVFPNIMSAYRKISINGSSYSSRYHRKTDMKSYSLRREIEEKSTLLFGTNFKYKLIDERYIIDAIINYLFFKSRNELDVVLKLSKTNNFIIIFFKCTLLVIFRLFQKIKFNLLNLFFLFNMKFKNN